MSDSSVTKKTIPELVESLSGFNRTLCYIPIETPDGTKKISVANLQKDITDGTAKITNAIYYNGD